LSYTFDIKIKPSISASKQRTSGSDGKDLLGEEKQKSLEGFFKGRVLFKRPQL
jgi:hypothetical protein